MSTPPRASLVRAIGRWSLAAAVINGVIGSAIFGMPAQLAALTGAKSPLAAILAGAGILLIVACFAEVASRYTEPGGPYLYTRDAFGASVGFQAGWLTFWIRVTSLSANLNVFALYLGELLPAARAGAGRTLAMLALVLVVTLVNLAGVRQATWMVNVFTAAKLLPLLALVALGASRVSAATLATQEVARPDWTQAVLLLVFAYGGFEAPLIPAGEARDPRRDSAFALLAAMVAIAGVYAAVQLVVVGVLPHAARTLTPIAEAWRVLAGPEGAVLASLGAMISVYGYTTGNVLQSPRLLYAMADRGEVPALFARVDSASRTPAAAVLAFAALGLAFAVAGSFAANAVLSAIVRLVTYGLTCAALLVLRRRRPQEEPGFRLPGAALIAPLAVAFCAWLLATRSFAQAWVLLGLMAAGALLHAAARRRAPGVSLPHP